MKKYFTSVLVVVSAVSFSMANAVTSDSKAAVPPSKTNSARTAVNVPSFPGRPESLAGLGQASRAGSANTSPVATERSKTAPVVEKPEIPDGAYVIEDFERVAKDDGNNNVGRNNSNAKLEWLQEGAKLWDRMFKGNHGRN